MAPWVDKARRWTRNLLLAFVLVTIGFALGKEGTLRSVRATLPDTPIQPPKPDADAREKVVVYYLHATFRCVTCNTIEKMTRNLLDSQFKRALADGHIEWKEADFQREEDLAKRFEVVSSCVVVVNVRDGKETDYQRLDEVWTLMNDPSAFEKYVGDAIRKYLPATREGGQTP